SSPRDSVAPLLPPLAGGGGAAGARSRLGDPVVVALVVQERPALGVTGGLDAADEDRVIPPVVDRLERAVEPRQAVLQDRRAGRGLAVRHALEPVALVPRVAGRELGQTLLSGLQNVDGEGAVALDQLMTARLLVDADQDQGRIERHG